MNSKKKKSKGASAYAILQIRRDLYYFLLRVACLRASRCWELMSTKGYFYIAKCIQITIQTLKMLQTLSRMQTFYDF